MTIPALPSLDRTSPTFRSDLDSFFLTQLPDTVTALNAELTRIDGILPVGFVGTSTTSLTIASSGSITLTVQSNKGFAAGQLVLIAVTADPATQMQGIVTSYNATTGGLILARTASTGSGTYSAWTVSMTAPVASPYSTGDIALTNRALTSPTWLPADGSIYSQSSYASLYAGVGLLANAPLTTKLANPATLPGTYAIVSSWDTTDTYLTVSGNASPFLFIYKRTGDTLTKLPDPDTLPAVQPQSISWDATGTYLAVSNGDTVPRLLVYKRTGDTFTKLTNPANLPAASVGNLKWDGDYLAMSVNASPHMLVYKRTGDSIAKLADPATLPAESFSNMDFKAGHIVIGHAATPFVEVYSVSGTSVTRLANPANLPHPGSGVYIQKVVWSPDGAYFFAIAYLLSVGYYYYSIFSRSGSTLTRVAFGEPSVVRSHLAEAVWHPSGKYIVCPRPNASPNFLTTFEFNGSTVTELPVPSSLPPGGCYHAAWNQAGTTLTIGCSASPWLLSYSFSHGVYSNRTYPSANPGALPNKLSVTSDGLYVAADSSSVSPYIHVYKNFDYDAATQFVVPKVQVTGTTAYIKA